MHAGGAAQRDVGGDIGVKSTDPRKHIAQIQPRLRDFKLRWRREQVPWHKRCFRRRRPHEVRIRARPGMRRLDRGLGDVQPGSERIEDHFRVDVDGGIVRTRGEIPTMQAAQFGAALQHPIITFRFRVNHQTQIAANPEIITVCEMQQVGKRGVVPRQIKHGRTQSRRSAAHVAGNANRARLLQQHGGTRRNSFQVQRPAAGTVRFDVAIYIRKREREFFVAAFEIDSSGSHVYAAEAHRGSW